MLKACREAKIRTSWHEPNMSYEENIRGFVDGVFEYAGFIDSLEAFIAPLILPGRINRLAQTLIKLVAPGVPDFYQGTELVGLEPGRSRQPAARRFRAARAAAGAVPRALGGGGARRLGRRLPKLWMTARVLCSQRDGASGDFLARQPSYQPLVAQGAHLGNLLAFRRGENLIAVVPRFSMTRSGEWGDTRLPLPRRRVAQRVHRRVRAGKRRARGACSAAFPVAILDPGARMIFRVWAPTPTRWSS